MIKIKTIERKNHLKHMTRKIKLQAYKGVEWWRLIRHIKIVNKTPNIILMTIKRRDGGQAMKQTGKAVAGTSRK